MNRRDRAARRPERGMTILEAMIGLSILLIGLLGTAQLQIYGIGATQGARAHTSAAQLALELGGALSRLDMTDPSVTGLLTGLAGATPDAPPSTFGRLLPLGIPTASNVHVWSDATPVPGARLDAAIERDPEKPAEPAFKRRWSVWDYGTTATGVPSKVVAVSIIFREQNVATPREVVAYVTVANRGASLVNIIGQR